MPTIRNLPFHGSGKRSSKCTAVGKSPCTRQWAGKALLASTHSDSSTLIAGVSKSRKFSQSGEGDACDVLRQNTVAAQTSQLTSVLFPIRLESLRQFAECFKKTPDNVAGTLAHGLGSGRPGAQKQLADVPLMQQHTDEKFRGLLGTFYIQPPKVF